MIEQVRYKVVTPDMKSLGLRKNPNILTFALGEVYTLPDDQIIEGSGDFGGIWVAAKIGGANTLIKYMAKQYDLQCRLFAVQIGRILYQNSYRIKTDSVLFLEELILKRNKNV